MDTLTFTSQMVGHLTWPGTVVTLGIIFREATADRIRHLRSFKAPGVDATFEDVAKVTADVEEKLGPQRTAALERLSEAGDQGPVRVTEAMTSQPNERVFGTLRWPYFAAMTPRAAVVEGWALIEHEARNAAERSGINLAPYTDTFRLIRHMVTENLLDKEALRLAQSIRTLRNSAAHTLQFGRSSASCGPTCRV